MSPKDALREALVALCQREGGPESVADKAELNAQNLTHIIKGVLLPSGRPRGVGPKVAEKLERAFPGWASPQRMTPLDEGVAHAPTVREITLPPVVTREQLMDPKFELPPAFEIAMPDDAMAPEIPAGRQLIFERTNSMPRPGTRILIADQTGRRHVRRFAEGRDGAWRALPDNRAHMDLDSAQDGLQLLAVLKWVGAD